jgi:hypothetical protein
MHVDIQGTRACATKGLEEVSLQYLVGEVRFPPFPVGRAQSLAPLCSATPSWVRPGTHGSKIHPSAGRTRERRLVRIERGSFIICRIKDDRDTRGAF